MLQCIEQRLTIPDHHGVFARRDSEETDIQLSLTFLFSPSGLSVSLSLYLSFLFFSAEGATAHLRLSVCWLCAKDCTVVLNVVI